MYTAEEFRQDLIANIKENNTFSPLVTTILQNSKDPRTEKIKIKRFNGK